MLYSLCVIKVDGIETHEEKKTILELNLERDVASFVARHSESSVCTLFIYGRVDKNIVLT